MQIKMKSNKHYIRSLLTLFLVMCATITFAHDHAESNSDGKTIYYNYNSDGSSVSVTYKGKYYNSYSYEYEGDVVIPETVTYSGKTYSVTSIGSDAFWGCSDLTSVTIPNSVTSIGKEAFRGCSGLTSVTIPNSVTSIDYQTFQGCSGLTSVTIPNSVTSIGTYAFYGCSSLTSVTIPNNVTSIGGGAFYGCSGLTSVTIPNSVTGIYSRAFYNTRIKSLTIGTGIQTIVSDAFGYNSSDSGAKPVKVIWLANTPPSGYKDVGGTINYVPNNSYSGLSGRKIYPFLSSIFEVDGIKYVPVSPSERTCDAIDCVYNESAENTKIGNTVTYKNINMTVQSVGNSICSDNTYIKTLECNFGGPIGSSAFSGCSGLTKVIVPDIKNWCSITFANSTANPLYYAHHLYSDENTEITKLVIPNDVTSINSYAFYGCSGLTSVFIPNSVTSIGSSAFYGCSGLQKVIVPNIDIKKWCNIKFSSSTDNPLYYAHHLYSDENTEITKLIIPNDVTSINSSAFYGCSGLTSVTIGNSVTSIGSSAFSYCSGLTSVTIPNSVTSIGSSAFSGCSGLTSVTIGNSVTSIGSSAFNGCSGLEKVIVPNIDIKNWCSIVFSSSTDNPLYYAHHLYSDENTEITKLVIPNDVTSINSYAFYGCSGLTSVTIPNSVTSIGERAFYECSGLKKVIVPDIKNWCSITFGSSSDNPLYYAHHLYSDENTEITKLVIPDGVTTIPNYVFSGCSGLTSVTIGNSVTSIGSYAFQGCSGLTSVTIPNSVTSIGSSAFYDCSGLKKVIVPDIKNWCSIKFGNYSANPLYYAHHLYSDENTEITKLVIPDDVTSIGSSAFYGCSGLTSVTIPNSVTSIGSSAFYDCSGLTSVTIPNSVTSIGSYAFSDCSGLTSVTIPNSVTSIGSYAFDGCSELTSITWNAKNYPAFSSASSSPFYGIRSRIKEFIICDDMTSIPKYMCYGMSNLKSVTIPNSVTSISDYAFSGCSGLTSVIIPNSVTSIGSSAFSGCSGLTSVTWNAKNYPAFSSYSSNPFYNIRTQITEFIIGDEMTSVRAYMCYGMSNLKSVTIPNSVTSIGGSAFDGCSGLTSVRFENSKDNTPVTLGSNTVFSDCPLDEVYIGRKLSYTTTSSAGYSPFYKKTTLRSVKFTDKETEISDYEFYGCTNLTDVSMGDGVKSIGTYAFSGCSSLEHFTCGRQLKSIGKEAFSDCTSMTKFRTRAAVPPTCGAQALDDINKWECTLYVPTESIDDYQAADQWKNFFFIEKFRVEGDSNGDDTVTMADANAIVNYFLAKGTDGFVEGDFDEEAADVNGDGEVTMADANQIVNMFLSGEK